MATIGPKGGKLLFVIEFKIISVVLPKANDTMSAKKNKMAEVRSRISLMVFLQFQTTTILITAYNPK